MKGMYPHVAALGTPLDRLFMPWYQPGDPRGYSKFFDGPDSSTGYVDPDRTIQWEVTDEYLNALERAFHQGQFDSGITNVEDTSARVFDFLASHYVTTTEEAYRLGRAQVETDPGGSVDPAFEQHTPGAPIPVTPPAQQTDTAIIYASGAQPSGQPLPPVGTSYGPSPIGGTAGPSPISIGGAGGIFTSRTGGINWLLILAIGAGAYFLLRKRS